MATLSDALRRAIRECGRSRYALSKESGVGQDILSRFMAGKSIGLDTADKLAKVLNIEVTHGKHNRRSGR